MKSTRQLTKEELTHEYEKIRLDNLGFRKENILLKRQIKRENREEPSQILKQTKIVTQVEEFDTQTDLNEFLIRKQLKENSVFKYVNLIVTHALKEERGGNEYCLVFEDETEIN